MRFLFNVRSIYMCVPVIYPGRQYLVLLVLVLVLLLVPLVLLLVLLLEAFPLGRWVGG